MPAYHLEARVPGDDEWFHIGSGKFDNARDAIDKAEEAFEFPVSLMRIKRVDEITGDDYSPCDTCGRPFLRAEAGHFVCECCGARTPF